MDAKKIVCLTGTRADYGKIKRIMQLLDANDKFELYIFVTGMHMHKEYGSTYNEVLKDQYKNVYLFINQHSVMASAMDMTLANTIEGFSSYVNEIQPDLIITHGDRIEALAAAIVGAMNNILVGHIEGGEISGTIDESIRHAVTKLAHIHLVSNEASKKRVMQLGEPEYRIFIIGSPDIDIMLSPDLPTWEETKRRYEIPFDDFAIALFHPVTTSHRNMKSYAQTFTDALIASEKNYIVIHPNNDLGRGSIIEEYCRLKDNPGFRVFLSVRFEHFLTMLKNTKFIIGNSSAGIREASVYGVPAIDIGDRQQNRYKPRDGLLHCCYDVGDLMEAISVCSHLSIDSSSDFGVGNSAEQVLRILADSGFWGMPLQKCFIDKD